MSGISDPSKASKTIANLPLEDYLSFAQRAEQGEMSAPLINTKDSRAISQSQSDNFIPFSINQYNLLFGLDQKNAPWAAFTEPMNYNNQSQRIFTAAQIAPSLGTLATMENDIRRVITKQKLENVDAPQDKLNPEVKAIHAMLELLIKLSGIINDTQKQLTRFHKA